MQGANSCELRDKLEFVRGEQQTMCVRRKLFQGSNKQTPQPTLHERWCLFGGERLGTLN